MLAETSREAYESIKKLGSKQKIVYELIQKHAPITNESISEKLDWPINRVTGRVNELCKMGLIKHDGYDITRSGRRAKTWKSIQKSQELKNLEQDLLFEMNFGIQEPVRRWKKERVF